MRRPGANIANAAACCASSARIGRRAAIHARVGSSSDSRPSVQSDASRDWAIALTRPCSVARPANTTSTHRSGDKGSGTVSVDGAASAAVSSEAASERMVACARVGFVDDRDVVETTDELDKQLAAVASDRVLERLTGDAHAAGQQHFEHRGGRMGSLPVPTEGPPQERRRSRQTVLERGTARATPARGPSRSGPALRLGSAGGSGYLLARRRACSVPLFCTRPHEKATVNLRSPHRRLLSRQRTQPSALRAGRKASARAGVI